MALSAQDTSSQFCLERVLGALDYLLDRKTNKHFNTLQVFIMRAVWEAATYETIAEQSCWSEAHVKSVGAGLWALLSDLLDQPVNKKNFRATVERLYPELLLAADSGNGDRPVGSPALEYPDGPITLRSSFYCERPPIETDCQTAIAKPGALIRIRAPRQMGKTSLLNRLLVHGQELGYRTVALNMQLVDTEILQNLDRFLQWFCARVTQKMGLPIHLTDYWDDMFGSKTSCKDYFENYLLPQCPRPLILALDDVDTLFAYPTTADSFFALLRAWYEDSKNTPLWQTLRLILVHSTDAYLPLQIHQSPFNVGLPINPPEFNPHQVTSLGVLHHRGWTAEQTEQLMELVGGHPYLIRLALYHLATTPDSLDHIRQTILSVHNPFYQHLQKQLGLLEAKPDLVAILKSLLDNQIPHLTPVQLFQLTRSGLITMQQGRIQIRCELYRQWLAAYF